MSDTVKMFSGPMIFCPQRLDATSASDLAFARAHPDLCRIHDVPRELADRLDAAVIAMRDAAAEIVQYPEWKPDAKNDIIGVGHWAAPTPA